MTTTSVTLSGFVYDNAGNAVQDATVAAYTSADNATSAIAGMTDTTDANGRWDLTTTDETKYPMDIKITFGSSVRWIKAGNGINVTRLTVSGAAVFGENDTGVDVTMYGATSGRYLLWDESEDALHLTDSTELKIGTLAAGDMVLYHDGTNSYIKNATGALKIATESSGIAVTIGHTTSEVTIGDNLTVTGDLTVSGDTITVSTSTVAIEDSLLLLAKNQGTSADAVDFGIYGKYGVGGTAKYAGIFRDLSATNDPWTFFDGLENEPGTTVNTSGTNYALAAITAAEIVGTTIDASTDFTIGSTIITDGVITDSSGLQLAANLDINGTSDISGTLTLGTVVNADADVDKFLVLDSSGNVDFRTGANVLSDIGATGVTALDDIGTGDAAATLVTTVGNITIDAQATDADVVIKVDDNGSAVTAVTFDGSDEGNAIFVNDIQLNSDGALLEFGADQDTVLTHTDGTGLTLNSTNKLTFGDTDSYVQQSTDGTLRIDGEAIIDLNASTRVDVSGDLKVGGEVQAGSIGYTDGDNSMTIADGGKVTFAAGFAVGSDAEGDVLYSNGTNYVRLARGSDADVLTLASGVPSWATPTTGDITGITTGDGLSGGATSGTPTLAVDLVSNGGLEFSSGELRVATGISQYDVAQFAASVADNDFLRIDGTSVEGLSASEVAAAIESSIDAVGTIGTGVWQGTAIASGYIAADAITGAKIADDAIDSEHYTDGSIDTAHIADNQVTLAKVADIARGSLIIGNASAATAELTKGSANTVLTSDGTDIAWAAASGGGITHASQWRLSSTSSGSTGYDPLVNWEAADTDGAGTIGTAMTYSSGVFTFPTTGIWLVEFIASIYTNGSTIAALEIFIETTVDNSTYTSAARGRNAIWGTLHASNTTASFIFDVTNTSNDKVQFVISGLPTNAIVNADTNRSQTLANFIRLGDT